MSDATYNTACRASEEYQDRRTQAQKRWDERSYAVSSHIAHMRALTQGCSSMSWSRETGALEAMEAYLKDALREVRALQIEGFREGDPVGGIPKLSPIETRPVGVERKIKIADFDQVGKPAA